MGWVFPYVVRRPAVTYSWANGILTTRHIVQAAHERMGPKTVFHVALRIGSSNCLD